MKFVSFLLKNKARFGISDGKTITDLTHQISEAKDLKELILKNGIEKAKKYAKENPGKINFDEIKFLPTIPNPGKIICVGLNYADHVDEIGLTNQKNPTIFLRVTESQTAHKEIIQKPEVSKYLDYECELAVIMGEGGKNIKPDDAFKYIVGYSCYNECTIRDWQEHTSQFTMGKNFEKTGSFGPWMTLAEDIPDYTKLTIETRLNGKTMQKAKLSQLIFNIPNLISYISKAMPWKAGDVLVTGTPGGVGFKRKPPIYLKDGDDVEVEISNIGILLNKVKNEKN